MQHFLFMIVNGPWHGFCLIRPSPSFVPSRGWVHGAETLDAAAGGQQNYGRSSQGHCEGSVFNARRTGTGGRDVPSEQAPQSARNEPHAREPLHPAIWRPASNHRQADGTEDRNRRGLQNIEGQQHASTRTLRAIRR